MSIHSLGHSLRRRVAWPLLILMLLALVAGAALAESGATQSATLTLGKTTSPAGGEDFPVTAVGFVGTVTTSFISPRDIDSDRDGNLYVVGNRASKVQVLNAAGQSIDKWGTKGRDPQEMFLPEDIAVVDDGASILVIVADTGNSRLQTFDEKGTFKGTIGGPGTGNGQFDRPQGVAVKTTGDIYVADTYNHRIQVFDRNGTYLRQWGSQGSANGQFSYPSGIELGPDGNVYVVDSNNNRVQVFSSTGQFLRKWGGPGTGPGKFNIPVHAFVAADGTVLVSDTYNHRVQKFSAVGRYLGQWGTEGTGNGQFERPNGIFITDDGLTYVVDIDNSRLELFAQATVFLDDGDKRVLNLPAATYDINEVVEGDWALDEVVCEGAAADPLPNGVQVTLADDDQVACTFANNGPATDGEIVAFKYHDLDQDGSFSAGDAALSGWIIRVRDDQGTTVGDDQVTNALGNAAFAFLPEGDYTVCEVLLTGWFNSEPGLANQPIPGAGQEVCQPATVVAGETSAVSIGNIQGASVAVTKESLPADLVAQFTFTSTIPALNRTISVGETVETTVVPGEYVVAESDPGPDYSLSGIACEGGGALVDLTARSAEFSLAGGEAVACVFTNELVAAQLTISTYQDEDVSGDQSVGDKLLPDWEVLVRDDQGNLIAGPAQTTVAGTATFTGLTPGLAQACQVLPTGWYNTDPGATDPGAGGPVVGAGQEICRPVELVAGQNVAAVFGNVAAATLIVAKVTEPAGAVGPFVFTSTVAGLNGGLGDGEQLTADVLPGTYSVTEDEPGNGFLLSAISCDNDDSGGDLATRTATFIAAPGETVTCTFTNTIGSGAIQAVVYQDVDGSGGQSAGDLLLEGWLLRLRDDGGIQIGGDVVSNVAGTVTFAPLLEGAYEVCMVLPVGWSNTDPGDAGQPIGGAGQEVCQPAPVVLVEETVVTFGNVELPPRFSLYLPIILNASE